MTFFLSIISIMREGIAWLAQQIKELARKRLHGIMALAFFFFTLKSHPALLRAFFFLMPSAINTA